MKEDFDKELSNSIFHFTKIETALEFILPKRSLKLNLLSKTNDPRENRDFGFGAVNPSFKTGKEIEQHLEWNKHISQRLKNSAKVLCFSTDYCIDNEFFNGYNLPRMWAQYGQNHYGVCLDINLDKFKIENADILVQCTFDNVKYSTKGLSRNN